MSHDINIVQKSTWPPIYVPLFAAGVMSMAALFLYNIYPIVLGWLAALTLGIDRFIKVFVDYPWIYSVVKNMLRGVYVLSTMAVLTFGFFVLVYIVLDEVILHQHNKRMIFHTARKATQAAILLQLIVGFSASLLLWLFPAFDALWWLPSFWTASVPRALYTATWEIIFVVFACAYVFSNRWKHSLIDAWQLVSSHKMFFFLWFAALFMMTWCPAWSLQRMGVTSPTLYVIGGVFLQTFVLTFGLIIFFQQSGEFDS
jgi:hypothetical protein